MSKQKKQRDMGDAFGGFLNETAAESSNREMGGNASRMVNAGFENEERFRWQESYSAFTFGEKALSDVVSYIHLQKEHHRDGTIHAYYEVME